ncbi:MAG: protein translocase subunit SecF [Chloroflexota bacterium]|jgi:preprotein translocase subunit SecF|nr:protein translocase subunit SecF [Chloroflexota bacterium]MEC9107276.1 protein translocase subunit SecF [Chloroflexota bacterium]|tara:strand:- start:8403 stop:9284 length:882 start_codon:yes stop_codon:yes gene_type:complete
MNLLSKRIYLFYFSIVAIVISIILLVVPGLPLGIDFTSGSTITYRWEDKNPTQDQISESMEKAGFDTSIIQSMGNKEFFIRTSDLGLNGKEKIDDQLKDLIGELPVTLDVNTVGSSVAENTIRNSIIAVFIASLFVMLYIIYAFRNVEQAYLYAIAAIITLIHDVFVVMGLFILISLFVGSVVNSIFIVGILTVIGYSVNDTIVIFDRIRENLIINKSTEFINVVNMSVRESVTRSLGTSVTTSIVILSMLLFGGQSLRDFLIVLLLGVIIGTYSSIFVASNLLLTWRYGLRK